MLNFDTPQHKEELEKDRLVIFNYFRTGLQRLVFTFPLFPLFVVFLRFS